MSSRRLRDNPRVVMPAGAQGPQPVVDVHWGYIPVPAVWQVIGKWGLPFGNEAIQLAPGPQRRNGWGDVSNRLIPMYNPNWQNIYPAITPGSQRQQLGMAQQGPSRYGVYKMRQAVTAAQVAASGAQILPFLNNAENPLIAPSNG